MQPEKVVRHDDPGRERRLGILIAGSEKGLSIRAVCVCRGKELQSRISMPRTFVKFVAASLGAFLHRCRTGTVHESIFSSLPRGMVCVQWGDVMFSAFSLCWGLLAGAAQVYFL